jgi:polysaccharide pyruvyl transferase WcaK-like protein
MKKILHIGIFQTKNLGDLVISEQLSNYLHNSSSYKVDFIDFHTLKKVNPDDYTETINEDPYIKKRYFPLVKTKIVGDIYWKYLEFLVSYRKEIYQEYLNNIDDYDIITIGGGNLIMSITNNVWAIKINTLIKLAKEHGKKVLIIAVGAGPILQEKSKQMYKCAIDACDYITVRDEFSKYVIENDLKANKKPQVSGDPALLLSNQLAHKEYDSWTNVNIAMSIMPFGKSNFQNLNWYKNDRYYINMYKEIIKYFYEKNNNIVFNLFSTESSDYNTIYELKNEIQSKNILPMENLKIVNVNNLTSLINFYSKQKIIIGTRMHSLIIAYTQSLPIVAISWQDKVKGFMQYIDLMENCIELNEVSENIDRMYNILEDEKFKKENLINNETKQKLRDNFCIIHNEILNKL